MNIFVGNLSFKTNEEELQREFEAFGEVDSVKIIVDQTTLRSRGFGFVTMGDQEQATAAIAGLNGKEIGGFNIKVNEARPREPRGGPVRARVSERPNSHAGAGSFGGGSNYGRGTDSYRPGAYSGSNNYGNAANSGGTGGRGGNRSRSGSDYGNRQGGGYGGGANDKDLSSIYDTKSGRGQNNKRGRGGRGSGGRPGGGRRSS